MLSNIFFSPSGIVQVKNESFVPKLCKNLIVVSVHVACKRVKNLYRNLWESVLIVKGLLAVRTVE